MVTMKTKGQTAIETIFVVLFILLAIGAITGHTIVYGHNIEFMASARAAAQGFAMKLTMEGTLTHLVRIDAVITDANSVSAKEVDIYVMSEDCTKANTESFNAFFKDVMDLDAYVVNEVKCSPDLYTDQIPIPA